jgi:hypothetical protein
MMLRNYKMTSIWMKEKVDVNTYLRQAVINVLRLRAVECGGDQDRMRLGHVEWLELC